MPSSRPRIVEASRPRASLLGVAWVCLRAGGRVSKCLCVQGPVCARACVRQGSGQCGSQGLQGLACSRAIQGWVEGIPQPRQVVLLQIVPVLRDDYRWRRPLGAPRLHMPWAARSGSVSDRAGGGMENGVMQGASACIHVRLPCDGQPVLRGDRSLVGDSLLRAFGLRALAESCVVRVGRHVGGRGPHAFRGSVRRF